MERLESTDGSEGAAREGESALQEFKVQARGLSQSRAKAQVRAEGSHKSLSLKLRNVLRGLRIKPEAQLKKSDVSTILQLLGLQLTAYQHAILNQEIDRAHHYNARSLQSWLAINQSFLLYLDSSLPSTIQIPTSLKRIREFRQASLLGPINASQPQTSKCFENPTSQPALLPLISPQVLRRSKARSHSKLAKTRCLLRPSEAEDRASVQPSCLLSGGNNTRGNDTCSLLRARLRDCIKRQRAEYVRNAEVLAETRDYCQKLRKNRSVLLVGRSLGFACAQ